MQCHCSRPAVARIVKKEGANKGRSFYTCDSSKRCNFFHWIDDVKDERATDPEISTKLPSVSIEHESVSRRTSSREEYHIYSDGACKGNTNVKNTLHPAGWGVAILKRNILANELILIEELYGPVILNRDQDGYLGAEVTSNNTAELCAIGEALRWILRSHELFDICDEVFDFKICYDSEYAAKSVIGEFNGKKNVRLIHNVRALLRKVRGISTKVKVSFEHVKGHSKNTWNDKADALANLGATGVESKGSLSGVKHSREQDHIEVNAKKICV